MFRDGQFVINSSAHRTMVLWALEDMGYDVVNAGVIGPYITITNEGRAFNVFKRDDSFPEVAVRSRICNANCVGDCHEVQSN